MTSSSTFASSTFGSPTFDPRAIGVAVPYDCTALQLTRPATACEALKPRKQSYRPVGRGGAGNFHPEVKEKTKTIKERWETVIGRAKSRGVVEGDAEKGSIRSRNGFWWTSRDKDL